MKKNVRILIVEDEFVTLDLLRDYLEESQIIRSSLTDFLKALPQDHFIQTHRSYIININFLEKIGGDFVVIGKTKVPVSRGFKESVLKKLKIYY